MHCRACRVRKRRDHKALCAVRNLTSSIDTALSPNPCRTASALYTMRCAPLLVAPWGLLNALAWLASGVLLTLFGLAAAVVRHSILCGCCLPAPPAGSTRIKGLPQPACMWADEGNSLLDGPVDETRHQRRLGMQVGLWVLLSEPYRAAGAALPRAAHGGIKTQKSPPGSTGPQVGAQIHPPPNVSRGGEFCDRVWTVPTDHFNQTEVGPDYSNRYPYFSPASDQARAGLVWQLYN